MRWLTQMLILSGTLNIGLSATFVYFALREGEAGVVFDAQVRETGGPALEMRNEATLCAYSTLSFEALLELIESKDLVEEGYRKRDLALACLVAFHHFHLERALGGLSLQQRKIFFPDEEGRERIPISVFPGLADYQYQAILQYARREKWPLTTQGLFFALKRNEERRNPSLLEAFSLTPEFHAVFTLFSRSGTPLPKEVVMALLAQGEWLLLSHFMEEQKAAPDLSPDRRREFLLTYLESGSKIALHLLFRTDQEFVAKRFTDEQLMGVLDQLDHKVVGFTTFVKELLTSPRSDALLKKAALKLYEMAGEEAPNPYVHQIALARFIPGLQLQVEEVAPLLQVKKHEKVFHTILPGDSLWKIARHYGVTIEALIACNHLESEKLRPGRKLEIPLKEESRDRPSAKGGT